jgi:nitrous oxidase accessory protein NosD
MKAHMIKLVRVPVALAAVLALGAFAAGSAAAKTLYVSPKGHNSGACTKTKPCKTISFATAKAGKGNTVTVAKGTYKEDVAVAKDIKLIGVGKPVINATGSNGILITGAGSRGAVVEGFVVQHALDEGILALQTSNVTIADNVVHGNNLGAQAKPLTGECAPQGVIPGDCGEGLHLMSVEHSKVISNTVTGNLGGILITDEMGPTDHNTITLNEVTNNLYDCGITLAGHNPHAVNAGVPAPRSGGVYDNQILDNVVNGNGVKGQGGGILLAAGAPGSGVYSNTVALNTANDNGLGGLTLHSHAPGQDLNGNKIINNSFSHDAVHGYPSGAPGDSDASITHTAGIVLFSAVAPLKGTVVTGNKLSNEYYGIWTQNVSKIKQSSNKFAKSVTVDLFQK